MKIPLKVIYEAWVAGGRIIDALKRGKHPSIPFSRKKALQQWNEPPGQEAASRAFADGIAAYVEKRVAEFKGR